jgi:hypothetical protein
MFACLIAGFRDCGRSNHQNRATLRGCKFFSSRRSEPESKREQVRIEPRSSFLFQAIKLQALRSDPSTQRAPIATLHPSAHGRRMSLHGFSGILLRLVKPQNHLDSSKVGTAERGSIGYHEVLAVRPGPGRTVAGVQERIRLSGVRPLECRELHTRCPSLWLKPPRPAREPPRRCICRRELPMMPRVTEDRPASSTPKKPAR